MNKYFNIAIAIIVLSILAGGAVAIPDTEPPSAVLKIGTNEQISGIGSYCWSESGKSICADMIGIITAKEPLLTSSPFTVHFSLPLQEPPQELQLNIVRVTNDDEIKRAPNSSRAWYAKWNYSKLPLERESDINLSLEPGLYVLNVFARWKEKGDVTYGFLIEVQGTGAVPAEEWNKTFGGPGRDSAYSVQQTIDGGYILAGSTESFGTGSRAWLIKTDFNGGEQWNRTFGTDFGAFSVQQTSDGGYILAGEISSSLTNDSDAFLVKTDSNGSEQWNRTFKGKYNTQASSAAQTGDGGYILAGRISRSGWFYGESGGEDILLIKTDIYGNERWNRTFEVTGEDWTNSVQQTTEGGYILAGWATSLQTTWYGAHTNTFEAWLIKTDLNGTQQWKKTFGETIESSKYTGQSNSPFTARQTSDGGYIQSGSMSWSEKERNPVWLIKTDANGKQLWNKKLGGWAGSVQQTSDGGYIMAGRTGSNGIENHALLIKTGVNGNELWNATFGRTVNGWADAVQQTKDGGYILAGTAGAGNDDAWLIKVGREQAEAEITNTPIARPTEKVAGFEMILAITSLSAVYIFAWKRRLS
ncbi:Uncharacterised protein [uncultured archaeon]|nr:Uncharacterised protein [uncultured archaeon]